MSKELAPIIIKRKKVIEGGHHGGAWKVAYADFVTAMMAFFLLMWLLGATTEKQRKGIADYFNPTIPVNKVSGGGDGAFGGDSVFTKTALPGNGSGNGVTIEDSAMDANGDTAVNGDGDTTQSEDGSDALEEIAELLSGKAGESMVSDLLQRHVITRLTDEGLIVEIFDIPGAPLFEGDDVATPELQEIVLSIAEVFRLASNEIAVEGHTATVPLAARENPVWELSAARADRVRQLLVASDISADRMQRVTGFADRKPVVSDRLAERNNRMEIILLRDRV